MVPEFLQVPEEFPLDFCRFAGEAVILEVAQEPVADVGPGETRQDAALRREIPTRLFLDGPRLGLRNGCGERVEEEEVGPVEKHLAGRTTGISAKGIRLPLVSLEEGVEPSDEIKDALGQPVSLGPDLVMPPEPGLQGGIEISPDVWCEGPSDITV